MPLKFFFSLFNSKIINVLASSFLCLTIFAVFVPIYPVFPDVDLESSWAFALNQANSQHLIFGEDIIFTLGPYSSVFTRSYHPDTDTLMLLGSFFFMICFSWLVVSQIKRVGFWWQLLLAGILASGFVILDAIFFLYLVLLVFSTMKFVGKDLETKTTLKSTSVYLLFFSPLGLLMLVKGNFLIITIVILVLCMIFLWLQGLKAVAVGILTVVVGSSVIFWSISNQPLNAILPYFLNTISMIGGYSEAMAFPGSFYEVIAYSITSVGLLIFLFKSGTVEKRQKYFLLISVTFILFLVFKSSFVRHDHYHSLIASSFILLFGLMLPLVLQKPGVYICCLLALLTWGFIQANHAGFRSIKDIPAVYKHFAKGFVLRVKEELPKLYDDRLAMISEQDSIPLMEGTTDIYSYNHTRLLASKNRWQPRPMMQSYGAYTSELAHKNADHIKSTTAPDNIIFKVEPIDDHLPSLEDGLSWPLIINNYFIHSVSDSFLFLKKKPEAIREAGKVEVFCDDHQLGEQVVIPNHAGILFVQIKLEQTTLGKIATTIYKPQELEITIQLTDGRKKHYRYIASMGKAGFILSPLIETNEEFGFFFRKMDNLKNKMVRSFTISIKDHKQGKGLWDKQYSVCINSIILNN